MDNMKRQKDMTSDDEHPKAKSVQYAIRKEWRAINNNSRKNEAAGPKQKQFLIMDVSGGESKV